MSASGETAVRSPVKVEREAHPLLRASWTPAVLVAGLLLIALFGASSSAVLQQVVTTGFVYLVVVVGLYTFVGLSGVVSFGHISFMGIGAYACALVAIPATMKGVLLPTLPGWLQSIELGLFASVAVGAVCALVFAAAIAWPIMRISGLAAAITLFAVLIVVNTIGTNWDPVTRGTRTMLGVPIETTLWVAFGFGVVAVLVAWVFQSSAAGLRLKMTREDEFGARSLGVSVARARIWGFLLSAVIIGIGGALYAHLQGSFTPADFYLRTTFLTIVMLVVGGMHSLSGAVIGTMVITGLQQLLNEVQDGISLGVVTISSRPGITQVALAVVLLLILVFRSEGITGGREIPLPRRWRSGNGGQPAAGADTPASKPPAA